MGATSILGGISDVFGVGGVATLGSDIIGLIDRFIPDKEKAQEFQNQFQLIVAQAQANSDHDQAAVDQAEASNPSMFIAGWRPMVGWVCAAAYAWQFVVEPLFAWFYTVLSKTPPPPLPVLDSSDLNTVLFGMLGLAGVHAYENIKTQK